MASNKNKAVELEGVTFSYSGVEIIREATFAVEQGEFICLVGPNGGGKSTLVKLILGLLKPDKGKISLLGGQPRKTRNRVGYLPQHLDYDPGYPVTALEVVLMGRAGTAGVRYSARDRQAAMDALDQVDFGRGAEQQFSELSGGQRQRVLIARALVCEPEALFLDEPANGLDLPSENDLMSLLEQLNRELTIVMVSHDFHAVTAMVDRVVCVTGKVDVHPTIALEDQEILRSVYGRRTRLIRHGHSHDKGGEDTV